MDIYVFDLRNEIYGSPLEDFTKFLAEDKAKLQPGVLFKYPVFDKEKQRVPEYKTDDDVTEFIYIFNGSDFVSVLIVPASKYPDDVAFELLNFKDFTIVNPDFEVSCLGTIRELCSNKIIK